MLLMAERRKRSTVAESRHALVILDSLSIEPDQETVSRAGTSSMGWRAPRDWHCMTAPISSLRCAAVCPWLHSTNSCGPRPGKLAFSVCLRSSDDHRLCVGGSLHTASATSFPQNDRGECRNSCHPLRWERATGIPRSVIDGLRECPDDASSCGD